MKSHAMNTFSISAACLVLLGIGLLLPNDARAQSTSGGGVGSAPTGDLLTTEGGRLGSFELAPKTRKTYDNSLGTATVLGLADPIIFRLFGQSIFDSIIVYSDAFFDKLFVNTNGSEYTPDGSVKLQVNGPIELQALANSSAPAMQEACVNDFGQLMRCTGGLGGSGGGSGTGGLGGSRP